MANAVAEFEDIVSSSNIAVIIGPVAIVNLFKTTVPEPLALNSKLALDAFVLMVLSCIVIVSTINDPVPLGTMLISLLVIEVKILWPARSKLPPS